MLYRTLSWSHAGTYVHVCRRRERKRAMCIYARAQTLSDVHVARKHLHAHTRTHTLSRPSWLHCGESILCVRTFVVHSPVFPCIWTLPDLRSDCEDVERCYFRVILTKGDEDWEADAAHRAGQLGLLTLHLSLFKKVVMLDLISYKCIVRYPVSYVVSSVVKTSINCKYFFNKGMIRIKFSVNFQKHSSVLSALLLMYTLSSVCVSMESFLVLCVLTFCATQAHAGSCASPCIQHVCLCMYSLRWGLFVRASLDWPINYDGLLMNV